MVFRADDVVVITLQVLLVHGLCESLSLCRGIGFDLTAQPRGQFEGHLIFRHGLSSQSSGHRLLFYDTDEASGQKSAASTCSTGQGHTSGKVVSGRSVSWAASRRARGYAQAARASSSGARLGRSSRSSWTSTRPLAMVLRQLSLHRAG